jgi:hypothetical protein
MYRASWARSYGGIVESAQKYPVFTAMTLRPSLAMAGLAQESRRDLATPHSGLAQESRRDLATPHSGLAQESRRDLATPHSSRP